jgi:hypothetical protein
VSARRRRLRILRDLEQDIADSEPGLYAFFLSFNRRGFGREMPVTERVSAGPLRRLMRRERRAGFTERTKDWIAEEWNDP